MLSLIARVRLTSGLKYDQLHWIRIFWIPGSSVLKGKGRIEDTQESIVLAHDFQPAKFSALICYLNRIFSLTENILSLTTNLQFFFQFESWLELLSHNSPALYSACPHSQLAGYYSHYRIRFGYPRPITSHYTFFDQLHQYLPNIFSLIKNCRCPRTYY